MYNVVSECSDCKGTGLYSGFAEGHSIAVICAGCNGVGAIKVLLREFTERKKKSGINKIRHPEHRDLWISYDEFEKMFPKQGI